MKRRKNAFTLMELAVTVIIIGIITVTVLVSFSVLVPRRLETEARKILADLCWARERAVSTHQHHAISFDIVNKKYSIYKSPTGTTADFIPANFLKNAWVEVSLALLQTNLWIYSPKGNTYGTDNIILNADGKTKLIRIFTDTGYAKIQ